MKIKSILLIASLLMGTSALKAQNVTLVPPQMTQAPIPDQSDAGLSVQARRLKADLVALGRDVRRKDTGLINEYSLLRVRRRYQVTAILHTPKDFDESSLSKYGIKVNNRVDNLLTVTIPTRRFVAFADAKVVDLIEVSFKARLLN